MNSGNNKLASVVIFAVMQFAVLGIAWAQDKAAAEAKNAADAVKAQAEKKIADAAATAPAAAPAKPAAKLNYLPPGKGVPTRREGGATRGGAGDLRELALSVVTPEHVGWASSAQPDLYWFVSRPVTQSVMLTIIPAGGTAIDPLFEGMLTAPTSAGIHAASLSSLKVTLEANVDYEWSISLVGDVQSRSRDILASGRVRSVPLSAELKADIANANSDARTEKLAGAGYWYDVVGLLRKNAPASATEIALYESAGLARIAKFLKEGV